MANTRVRKQRSNKGKPRSPYTKRITVRKQRSNKGVSRKKLNIPGLTPLKGVKNTKGRNVMYEFTAKPKRKPRSNKGKPRGPYKKKVVKQNNSNRTNTNNNVTKELAAYALVNLGK